MGEPVWQTWAVGAQVILLIKASFINIVKLLHKSVIKIWTHYHLLRLPSSQIPYQITFFGDWKKNPKWNPRLRSDSMDQTHHPHTFPTPFPSSLYSTWHSMKNDRFFIEIDWRHILVLRLFFATFCFQLNVSNPFLCLKIPRVKDMGERELIQTHQIAGQPINSLVVTRALV
jgi:hypothetical protein